MILLEEQIGDWKIVISKCFWGSEVLLVISMFEEKHGLCWNGQTFTGKNDLFQPWWIDWENEKPEADRSEYPASVWNLACEMIRKIKKLRSFQ